MNLNCKSRFSFPDTEVGESQRVPGSSLGRWPAGMGAQHGQGWGTKQPQWGHPSSWAVPVLLQAAGVSDFLVSWAGSQRTSCSDSTV